jgi:hypothetical protein
MLPRRKEAHFSRNGKKSAHFNYLQETIFTRNAVFFRTDYRVREGSHRSYLCHVLANKKEKKLRINCELSGE